jgi:beta-glucanase (GH16 family)
MAWHHAPSLAALVVTSLAGALIAAGPRDYPPGRQTASAGKAGRGIGVSFSEDFAGPSLDSTVWAVMNRRGDATNNEPQCYRPENVKISDGALAITVKAEAATCNDTKPDGTRYRHSSAYTSGMVQWRSLSFLYGTVEIRARMTGGKGPWPALWLLGIDCQEQNITGQADGPCRWPQPGSDEIDIADVLFGKRTEVYQAIHSGKTDTGCWGRTTDMSRDWHVYGLVWQPGSLTWTIDGQTTCRLTDGVPATPMFLILNVAVGGNSGGPVDAATLPQTMLVDYVTVRPLTEP